MLQYQVWVEGSWSFKNPALRWKMPLGIWSFEDPFLGWKDLWNSSSLYCGRWCNSQVFDTEASISSLGWKDPGASKTLLWGRRCLWTSGALNISFWGGRISGTPVPCIAMAGAIPWNGSTLERQYGFWGEWILGLLISCTLWRKMPCASGLFNVRFGVEGSLELLVSAVGVDGALSSALDACKLKCQLHIQAHYGHQTQNNFYTVIKRLQ